MQTIDKILFLYALILMTLVSLQAFGHPSQPASLGIAILLIPVTVHLYAQTYLRLVSWKKQRRSTPLPHALHYATRLSPPSKRWSFTEFFRQRDPIFLLSLGLCLIIVMTLIIKALGTAAITPQTPLSPIAR